MPRISPFDIVLAPEERRYLELITRRYTSPYCEVVRSKIILMAAEGTPNESIASRLNTPRQIVSKWRRRFYFARLRGLDALPRGGRPRRVSS
jgi:transposase